MDKDNEYRFAAWAGTMPVAHIAAYWERRRLADRLAACHKARARNT